MNYENKRNHNEDRRIIMIFFNIYSFALTKDSSLLSALTSCFLSTDNGQTLASWLALDWPLIGLPPSVPASDWQLSVPCSVLHYPLDLRGRMSGLAEAGAEEGINNSTQQVSIFTTWLSREYSLIIVESNIYPYLSRKFFVADWKNFKVICTKVCLSPTATTTNFSVAKLCRGQQRLLISSGIMHWIAFCQKLWTSALSQG